VLCCVVLCCVVLCCVVLCCVVLCCVVLCCVVLCCVALYCAVLCCVALCSIVSCLVLYWTHCNLFQLKAELLQVVPTTCCHRPMFKQCNLWQVAKVCSILSQHHPTVFKHRSLLFPTILKQGFSISINRMILFNSFQIVFFTFSNYFKARIFNLHKSSDCIQKHMKIYAVKLSISTLLHDVCHFWVDLNRSFWCIVIISFIFCRFFVVCCALWLWEWPEQIVGAGKYIQFRPLWPKKP
jgi:hypothetical protein